MRKLVLLAAIAALAPGCGSRCQEVESARSALRLRAGVVPRGPDVRVSVPLAAANTFIAEVLAAQPVTAAVTPPELGTLGAVVPVVTAHLRAASLEPAGPDKIRFAARIEFREPDAEVATIGLVAEVAPELVRADGEAELVFGLAPDDLVRIRPALGPDGQAALGAVVSRWLPAKVRGKVPRAILDAAAARLAEQLVGTAYIGLRATVLTRLDELTRLRVRLPDVPVAHHTLRTIDPGVLVIELDTGLAVRRGLGEAGEPPSVVTVELAGSAVAELANWAIQSGRTPQWYARSLKPDPAGEFRPRFDFIPEDTAHPWKVYSFQERGGCSYFRVGVDATVALRGDQLEATVVDRVLERKSANPVIEVLAWAKYFITGSFDVSRRVAAHTRLTVAGRVVETRVVEAGYFRGEARFGLAFAAAADIGR